MANIERNHKDNVFCMLYRDKGNLLSLYNAVNGTEYGTAEGLEVVTLDYAICVRMRNDAAFVIGTSLNLYEQQSTVNSNMPLRDLYYIAEELKRLVPMERLYRRATVRIPVPRFVVFYNGKEAQPKEKVLRLSDLYEAHEGDPDLELVVRQININPGHNEDILKKCESLGGYMTFVNKVRGKAGAGKSVETAVTESVDECIREGVLTDFFREHRSEVIDMGIYEIDDETYERVIREEGVEEGRAEGQDIRLIEQIRKKVAKGKSLAQIAEEIEETESSIRSFFEAVCAAPEKTAEEILYTSRICLHSQRQREYTGGR